ncbi:MAG: hypothetical protein GY867_05500 [bacterium]|nr:hypothetical protein [bacterium]
MIWINLGLLAAVPLFVWLYYRHRLKRSRFFDRVEWWNSVVVTASSVLVAFSIGAGYYWLQKGMEDKIMREELSQAVAGELWTGYFSLNYRNATQINLQDPDSTLLVSLRPMPSQMLSEAALSGLYPQLTTRTMMVLLGEIQEHNSYNETLRYFLVLPQLSSSQRKNALVLIEDLQGIKPYMKDHICELYATLSPETVSYTSADGEVVDWLMGSDGLPPPQGQTSFDTVLTGVKQ